MKAFRRMREGLAGTTKKCAREEMTSLLRAQSWDHVIVFFSVYLFRILNLFDSDV